MQAAAGLGMLVFAKSDSFSLTCGFLPVIQTLSVLFGNVCHHHCLSETSCSCCQLSSCAYVYVRQCLYSLTGSDLRRSACCNYVMLLQDKKQKNKAGNSVIGAVQQLDNGGGGKQHPLLTRLHDLASHLLCRHCSARTHATPHHALIEVKELIAMGPCQNKGLPGKTAWLPHTVEDTADTVGLLH